MSHVLHTFPGGGQGARAHDCHLSGHDSVLRTSRSTLGCSAVAAESVFHDEEKESEAAACWADLGYLGVILVRKRPIFAMTARSLSP